LIDLLETPGDKSVSGLLPESVYKVAGIDEDRWVTKQLTSWADAEVIQGCDLGLPEGLGATNAAGW
jgi:hypothetical protein